MKKKHNMKKLLLREISNFKITRKYSIKVKLNERMRTSERREGWGVIKEGPGGCKSLP